MWAGWRTRKRDMSSWFLSLRFLPYNRCCSSAEGQDISPAAALPTPLFIPSLFPIWKYHPLPTRILVMQSSMAPSPPFFPMLSQAQTDSVLTYPSVHSDPGRMDTRCQRHQWIRCRMSFLLCRQSSSMPGDFSFLPRPWHNLCLHTSALVFCLASWLPMGVESSPDLFPPLLYSLSLFFFLTQSPVSCFTLLTPFSRNWTLIPRLSDILGDAVWNRMPSQVCCHSCLSCQTPLHPFPLWISPPPSFPYWHM